jgi:hypothetical protein
MIHLYTLGFRNDDLLKFKLNLNNPSKIAELQELEHFKSQMDVAAAAKENGFSKHWIFTNVLKIKDSEFVKIQRELFYDKAMNQAIEGAEAAGGSAGGLGGDLGGLPTAEPEAEKAPEAPPEEESDLLAAPARREDGSVVKAFKDGSYLTTGANGKVYMPVKVDNRTGAGPRTRHMSRQHTPEIATAADRNLFKGKQALDTFASGIVNESVESDFYEKDEKLLLEMEQKLQSLSKKLVREGKDDETQQKKK